MPLTTGACVTVNDPGAVDGFPTDNSAPSEGPTGSCDPAASTGSLHYDGRTYHDDVFASDASLSARNVTVMLVLFSFSRGPR